MSKDIGRISYTKAAEVKTFIVYTTGGSKYGPYDSEKSARAACDSVLAGYPTRKFVIYEAIGVVESAAAPSKYTSFCGE